MSRASAAALAIACLSFALPATAHKPSDSYLTLAPSGSSLLGHWDLALRDLDRALTLDRDGDGNLTRGELRTREAEVVSFALAHLQLRRGKPPCQLAASEETAALLLVEHSDGRYVRLPWRAECGDDVAPLELQYGLFFEADPQHRAIVRVRQSGTSANATEQTFVVTKDQRAISIELAGASVQSSMPRLVGQGVAHILSGLDHVLFLIALLLPAMVRRKTADAVTPPQIRSVLGDVVRVVTAFTIAHSLTLGLSALGLVSVSAEVIEPAIAASVAVAALDNLWPVFDGERFWIAFALGLLHGFGFSSALSDLGLSGGALLRGLFAFNAGVELGQLAIVLLFVPLALLLRNERFYRFVFLRAGSVAIAAISLVWFYQRILGG